MDSICFIEWNGDLYTVENLQIWKGADFPNHLIKVCWRVLGSEGTSKVEKSPKQRRSLQGIWASVVGWRIKIKEKK